MNARTVLPPLSSRTCLPIVENSAVLPPLRLSPVNPLRSEFSHASFYCPVPRFPIVAGRCVVWTRDRDALLHGAGSPLPESGGEYIYVRRGFGDLAPFLYGWMSTIVMYPGVAAALAVGATAYITTLIPATKPLGLCIPAALLQCFGAMHILGTQLSAQLMTSLNALKFLMFFGLAGWVVLSGHAHVSTLLAAGATESWIGRAVTCHGVRAGKRLLRLWRLVRGGQAGRRDARSEAQFTDRIRWRCAASDSHVPDCQLHILTVVPISGVSSSIDFVSQWPRAFWTIRSKGTLRLCPSLGRGQTGRIGLGGASRDHRASAAGRQADCGGFLHVQPLCRRARGLAAAG